ncbi:hypothetical protein A9G13_01290 [Gilliamella sp. wkB178]|uniref:hypothetical protein n=1 Tax=Gilliamella sp. wkB178 TaxID=3120259 RepID=UPI00080EE3B1|nr:hypothetical protein [Gilliamella apicola]OCG08723.1 hypothetical protein A9G13_01290 [Gilliamella apicola]
MTASTLGIKIVHLTKLGLGPKLIVYILFAFEFISLIALYLIDLLSLDETIVIIAVAVIVDLILYVVFASFARKNTDMQFFEKGLIIKKGKQSVSYLYNQVKNFYFFPDQHGFISILSIQMDDDPKFYSSNKLGGGNKEAWVQTYIDAVFEEKLTLLAQNKSLTFEYLENKNNLLNYLVGRNYLKNFDDQKKKIVLTQNQIQVDSVNVSPYSQLQSISTNDWKNTITITDIYGNEFFSNDYSSLSQCLLFICLVNYLIAEANNKIN